MALSEQLLTMLPSIGCLNCDQPSRNRCTVAEGGWKWLSAGSRRSFEYDTVKSFNLKRLFRTMSWRLTRPLSLTFWRSLWIPALSFSCRIVP